MTLFMSTHINKVDTKGRVSVPAQFRAAVVGEAFQGVVLLRSNVHAAIDGYPLSYMEEISRRLDNMDILSSPLDSVAAMIFGDAMQFPFDGDGRITLPKELLEFAGITDFAAFMGIGKKFQIWSPEKAVQRKEEARHHVRESGLTLPKVAA